MRCGLDVVDGRPDRDIGATRALHLVIQNGRILDRDSLKLDPETDPGFGAGC